VHRAVLQAQRLKRPLASGAEILVGLFAERLSFAVQLLNEQAMTVFDAVNFVVHGIAKGNGVETA
jgi:ATP-dependent Clp protease ATP-binding subunit ClpA